MATLGERVITFKMDFGNSSEKAESVAKALAKVALAAVGVTAAIVGINKVMQTEIWARFSASVLGTFSKVTPIVKGLGEVVENLFKQFHKLEFGALAIAGPLGKLVTTMSEIGVSAGAMSVVFSTLGLTSLAKFAAAASIASQVVTGAILAITHAIGSLVESLGSKLTAAANHFMEVGLEFEKQQFGLEIAVKSLSASMGGAAVNAEDLVKKIRDISAVTGISAAEIKQGVNVMFEMSRVTKLTGDQIDELLASMADFSVVRGVSFAEVVYAVDQSFRGWYQSANALGLSLDDNSVSSLAAEKNFASLGAVSGQATDVTNRFRATLDQMHFALGASAESADKLASGALRKLQGELNTINGLLGLGVTKFWLPYYQVLVQVATAFRTTFGESGLKAIGFLTALGGVVLETAGKIIKLTTVLVGLSAALGIASLAFVVFTNAAKSAALVGFIANLSIVRTILTTLGFEAALTKMAAFGAANISLSSIMSKLTIAGLNGLRLSFIALLTPVALIAAKIAIVIATIYLLYQAIMLIESETHIWADTLKDMEPLWESLKAIWNEIKDGVLKALTAEFKIITTVLTNVVAVAVALTANAFVDFARSIYEAQSAIKGFLGGDTAELDAKIERLGKIQDLLLGFAAKTPSRIGASVEKILQQTYPASNADAAFKDFAKQRKAELDAFSEESMAQSQDYLDAVKNIEPAQQQEIKRLQSLADATGDVTKKREQDLKMFQAQLILSKVSIEEFNTATRIFKQNQDEQARSAVDNYSRMLGLEKAHFEARLQVQLEGLNRQKIAAEQINKIEISERANFASKQLAFDADILDKQGLVEEATRKRIQSEVQSLRAAGVDKDAIQQIELRKLQDFENQKIEMVTQSTEARVQAEQEARRSAVGATTGATAGSIATDAEVSTLSIKIQLNQRLLDIKRRGIEVERLSAQEQAKASAQILKIQIDILEKQKQLALQQAQTLTGAFREIVDAANDVAQEFLRSQDREFSARILELNSRRESLRQETQERINQINASTATVNEKETQITEVLQSEALKRQQIFMQEAAARKQAQMEAYNLEIELEQRRRNKERSAQSLIDAKEDLAAAKSGRSISAAKQRQRAIRAAENRVQDLTPSDAEQAREEIGNQTLQNRLLDARSVAQGANIGESQTASDARGRIDQIQQRMASEIQRINNALRQLSTEAINAAQSGLNELNKAALEAASSLKNNSVSQPSNNAKPGDDKPGSITMRDAQGRIIKTEKDVGDRVQFPAQKMSDILRAGKSADVASSPITMREMNPSPAISDIPSGDKLAVAYKAMGWSDPEGARDRMAAMAARYNNNAPFGDSEIERYNNIQNNATGSSNFGFDITKINAAIDVMNTRFQKAVEDMASGFDDKTSGIPASILGIVKDGLPEELVDQRRRTRGDR